MKTQTGRAYAQYASAASVEWLKRYNHLTRLIEAGKTQQAQRYARRHGLVYPRPR